MKILKKLFVILLSLITLSSAFMFGCESTGARGPAGANGANGVDGVDGINGADGKDGATWLNGYTLPLDTIGKDGDFYLNVNSRDIYKKENSKWSLIGNMQGKELKRNWSEDGSLKILAIGNSFSDDALWLLPEVLLGLGITNFRVSILYIGGCALDGHLANINSQGSSYEFRTNTGSGWSTQLSTKIDDGLNADDWDYITVQQRSGYSGLSDTYSDLTAIISHVLKVKPKATLAWHSTWAYQQNVNHADFANYDNDQMTMYNAINRATRLKVLPDLDINFIIPNGTVIQNARTSWLGDNLTRDGYHLSYDIGRYITAITYAYTMTGYDISKLNFVPAGIEPGIREIAIESVLNAVKNPYSVTQSTYTERENLQEKYTLLSDYGWSDLAFWNSGDTVKYYHPIFDESNSTLFVCTKMFDRTTLPVGSIIEIDAGWAYRPDAWVGNTAQDPNSRPNMVTTYRIVVNEAWWGNYDTRAFNICKSDLSSIVGIEDNAKAAFRIWLPK